MAFQPMMAPGNPLRLISQQKINAQVGTTYTYLEGDCGQLVTHSNASSITATIPPNSTTAFPIGSFIDVIQIGAGVLTIAAGAGVTISSISGSLTVRGQYVRARLLKVGTNLWYMGDVQEQRVIRTVAGTTDTPTHADLGKIIQFTSSSSVTITLDHNQSFVTGDWFDYYQDGSGVVTAASSDTVLPGVAALRTQGSAATAIYLGSSKWLLVGDFQKGALRVVTSISSPTTAGSTTGFDYTYLVSGTTTLTLPTAVGNTNCYTVKNSGSAVVSVATTSSQTIDGGAAPITIPAGQSLDIISDNANWWIT